MRARTVLLLVGLLPLTAAAEEEMILLAGSVPDDLREIAGKPHADGSSDLKAGLRPAAHLAGSRIAMLKDDHHVIVVDTDNDAVVVLDAPTRRPVHTIAVGRRPDRLVVGPRGKVFVTNRGSRSLSVVDPVRGAEIRSVAAGIEPRGLALTPDGKTLLVVSSATSQLLVFDADSLALRHSAGLRDAWPQSVAVHPDGKRAFVTHLNAAR